MIKLENCEIMGWEHAIRGMRNPMNSWEKSDSEFQPCAFGNPAKIGENDLDLMTRLRNAGTDHRKFMRMITVYVDITAPLYFWKEFDTYKVGTTANSCSTMHKIHEKEFTLEDFSHEKLLHGFELLKGDYVEIGVNEEPYSALGILEVTIDALNHYRNKYLETKTKPMKNESMRAPLMKKYWYQMIQLLPSSYNQKRTVMLNYEVLANIYKSRKTHKLDEWRELCKWVEGLPYSELITGPSLKDVPICNEIMDEARRRQNEKTNKTY